MDIKIYEDRLHPEDVFCEHLVESLKETDLYHLPKPNILFVSTHNSTTHFKQTVATLSKKKSKKDWLTVFTGVRIEKKLEAKLFDKILDVELNEFQRVGFPYKATKKELEEKGWEKIKDIGFFLKEVGYVYIFPDLLRGAYFPDCSPNIIEIVEKLLIELEIVPKNWRVDLKELIEEGKKKRELEKLKQKRKIVKKVFNLITASKKEEFNNRLVHLKNEIDNFVKDAEISFDRAILFEVKARKKKPEYEALLKWKDTMLESYTWKDFQKSFANLHRLKELNGAKLDIDEINETINLLIHTKPIICRDEHTREKHNIGTYEIKLPFPLTKPSQITFKKLDVWDLPNEQHPHINSVGTACWGPKIPKTLKKAIIEDNINLLVCVLLDFLQSYNAPGHMLPIADWKDRYGRALKKQKKADKKMPIEGFENLNLLLFEESEKK